MPQRGAQQSPLQRKQRQLRRVGGEGVHRVHRQLQMNNAKRVKMKSAKNFYQMHRNTQIQFSRVLIVSTGAQIRRNSNSTRWMWKKL